MLLPTLLWGMGDGGWGREGSALGGKLVLHKKAGVYHGSIFLGFILVIILRYHRTLVQSSMLSSIMWTPELMKGFFIYEITVRHDDKSASW